ncbi:MAG: hypothetical protein WD771_01595 [Gemmatimonadaceae bacterium]
MTRSARRIATSMLTVAALAACAGGNEQRPTANGTHRTTSGGASEDPVDLAREIFEREELAARKLFSDSTGETEGDEHLRYAVFSSSAEILRFALATDSLNAQGWYLRGAVASRRAYRGFGSWNLDDQREAVGAFQRAQELADSGSALRLQADSAYRRAVRTLEEVQRMLSATPQ